MKKTSLQETLTKYLAEAVEETMDACFADAAWREQRADVQAGQILLRLADTATGKYGDLRELLSAVSPNTALAAAAGQT